MNYQKSNKRIAGTSILSSHIESFLENTAASVYWKDKKGTYLGVNDMFIKVSGMGSYDDAIGKTDLDLLWNEQAPLMMQNDQEIIYTRLWPFRPHVQADLAGLPIDLA